MARHANTVQKPLFLPDGVREFLQKRFRECVGAVMFVAAAALAVAIGTFDAADPGFNNATGQAASNWLGWPGAFTADWILHALGLIGLMPALILACWGWRVVSHRGFLWFWFHALLAPFAVIGAAAAAASVIPSAAWPLGVGYGGVIGDLVLHQLGRASAALGLDIGTAALGYGVGVLALMLTMLTLGITPGEWHSLLRALWRLLRAAGRGLARLGRRAIVLIGGVQWRPPVPARREPTIVRRESREVAAPAPRSQPRVAPAKAKPKRKSRRVQAEEQPSLDLLQDGEYAPPPLHLLHMPDDSERNRINEDALEQNARLLEGVLDDYGVRGRIINVRPGPVVTLYELEPAPGTKASRVIGLADDIARSMSAVSVRVAVVPGRNAIGIELPNQARETVYLRELLATADYDSPQAALNLSLGKDIGGEPIFADLAKMPHLLIAGTTGSGKSVGINTMILSLLYRQSPEQCRLILIDPKMLELSVYDHIPHLLTPVVTDPGKAVVALKWAVREMESRYKAMASLGVRNINGYNQRLRDAKKKGEELTRRVQTGFDPETGDPIIEIQSLDMEELPYIVVVVDEMADLMMVAGKDIEGAVQRLAQMARAAGIHVVLATQRPSVDVITGTIKANFPTRISFQVTSKVDSRTILGEMGAEQLLGQGDMLYMAGGGRITRVHGPFVSDEEVEAVVKVLRNQGRPDYLAAVTEDLGDDGVDPSGGPAGSRDDALYDKAVDIVARNQKASTSFIQRHLKIGYNRAALLIEMMEEDGVIGPANHVGKREVFVRNPDEDEV